MSHIAHVALRNVIIITKFKLGQRIRSWLMTSLLNYCW